MTPWLANAAVVALESTIITHGLPRPQNLEAALAAEAAVRAAGAIPATIATRDGRIRVGLDADELAALADAQGLPKVSRQNLAGVLTRPGWGGTTVSATMIAAALAGIDVFATGGIGGVHRGGEASLDISADLDELARTPVTVVCAGPKSILDVGRTLEALETRGVPVVAWQSDEVAGFYSRSSGHRAPLRVDSADEAARLIANPEAPRPLDGHPHHRAAARTRSRYRPTRSPPRSSRPKPKRTAAGIHGPASTPFVLSRVAELTDGRSVRANLALIEHNADVAGQIAALVSLARPTGIWTPGDSAMWNPRDARSLRRGVRDSRAGAGDQQSRRSTRGFRLASASAAALSIGWLRLALDDVGDPRTSMRVRDCAVACRRLVRVRRMAEVVLATLRSPCSTSTAMTTRKGSYRCCVA